MRLLLCTDTHGDLRSIERLATEHRPDAILHAGDFGFYRGADKFDIRALRLLVKHAHPPVPEVNPDSIESMDKAALLGLIEQHRLLGDFPGLVSGEWKLPVPVYAVWGNHEDGEVVQALRSGDLRVSNLKIVDEDHLYALADGIHLAGIGGNCVLSKLFSPKEFESGGKVAMNANQLGALRAKWDALDPNVYRIFLTHVSPARELVMQLYVAQLAPSLCVSGHMGPPRPVSYNHYAFTDRSSLIHWWEEQLNVNRDLCQELRNHPEFAGMLGIGLGKERLQIFPDGLAGTKKTWFLNLPDSLHGCAVLELDVERETESMRLLSQGCLHPKDDPGPGGALKDNSGRLRKLK